VSQVLACIRISRTGVARAKGFSGTHPRWEPDAGKPHVRICAGALGNERPYRDRLRLAMTELVTDSDWITAVCNDAVV
jgi:hypothetical protein